MMHKPLARSQLKNRMWALVGVFSVSSELIAYCKQHKRGRGGRAKSINSIDMKSRLGPCVSVHVPSYRYRHGGLLQLAQLILNRIARALDHRRAPRSGSPSLGHSHNLSPSSLPSRLSFKHAHMPHRKRHAAGGAWSAATRKHPALLEDILDHIHWQRIQLLRTERQILPAMYTKACCIKQFMWIGWSHAMITI